MRRTVLPLVILTLVVWEASCREAGEKKLLKVPRIYNALISSDEELLPSQAYPAVAPVLRPAHPVILTPANGYLNPASFTNNRPPGIPSVPPPPVPVSRQAV